MIQVQYFALYREALGCEGEQLEGAYASVDQLRRQLVARGGAWQVLDETRLMCARNQELCRLDEPLAEGDEVAFFPPVTGG